MRLEQLHYLEAIVNHQSINAAANALHMTQQSLSNSMKNLEQEIGTQIFQRTHQGVHLTPNGQIIFQTGQAILALWEDMHDQITSDDRLVFNVPLKILSSPRIIDNLLSKPLIIYQKNYPQSQIICEDETFEQIVSGTIDTDSYDLIITTLYFKDEQLLNDTLSKIFYFVPLFEHELLLVAHRDSEIASLNYISSTRLKQLDIRVYGQTESINNSRSVLTDFYQRLGVSYNLRYSNSISYCVQGVCNNMFYVLCPKGIQSQLFEHPNVKFIPIRINFKLVTGYLIHEQKALSSSAKKFIEILSPQNREK